MTDDNKALGSQIRGDAKTYRHEKLEGRLAELINNPDLTKEEKDELCLLMLHKVGGSCFDYVYKAHGKVFCSYCKLENGDLLRWGHGNNGVTRWKVQVFWGATYWNSSSPDAIKFAPRPGDQSPYEGRSVACSACRWLVQEMGKKAGKEIADIDPQAISKIIKATPNQAPSIDEKEFFDLMTNMFGEDHAEMSPQDDFIAEKVQAARASFGEGKFLSNAEVETRMRAKKEPAVGRS